MNIRDSTYDILLGTCALGVAKDVELLELMLISTVNTNDIATYAVFPLARVFRGVTSYSSSSSWSSSASSSSCLTLRSTLRWYTT